MNYTMSQRHTQNTSQIKKYLLNPQVMVILLQVKILQEGLFSEYEMPISFQASAATFQDNFFKIL